MKKGLALFLIVAMIMGLIATACAPAETNTKPDTSTPVTSENSRITIQHIIGNFTSNYTFDYVEDKENGYGCYIYDGSESGSIFCFKLGG